MNRKRNIIVFIINIFMILAIITILLILKQYIYILFFITLLIIIILLFYKYLKSTISSEAVYISYLKHLKKSFGSILLNINELPDLKDKLVINISNIEDLFNLQIDLKKPILLYEEKNSSTFIIISNEDVYVSILRLNDNANASIESVSKKTSITNLKEYQKDSLINTTIIKVDKIRKILAAENHDKDIDLPKLK